MPSPAGKAGSRRPYFIRAEDDDQTLMKPSEWLSLWMSKKGISDNEMLKGLQERGYQGDNRAVVYQWRTGRTSIPPEVFRWICEVLDFSPQLTAMKTYEVLTDAYPELAEYFHDPFKAQKDRVEAYQRGFRDGLKKASQSAPKEEDQS